MIIDTIMIAKPRRIDCHDAKIVVPLTIYISTFTEKDTNIQWIKYTGVIYSLMVHAM